MSDLELNLSSLVERQESPSSLVRFEDTSDENVPRLRYSVPLPGGISGKQYVIIEPRNVAWTQNAFNHNPVIDNLNEFIRDGDFTRDVDLRPVSEIANVGIVNRRTTDDVTRIDEAASTIRRAKNIASGTSTMAIESKETQLLEHYDEQPRFVRRGNNNELLIKVKDLEIPFSEVSSAAKRNKILTIYKTFGGDTRYTFTDIVTSGGIQDMRPNFVIIEHYKLSSFFEDYGAGRTLGVFSLMPGEETTIKERHWRRSDTKEKSSSSVFDSFTSEARNEFEEGFEEENTDKKSYSDSISWHVKAKASANFGVASASVEGGAEGSTASAREQLGKKASKTTKKHAESASNKRDISVTTEVEESTSEEFETIKERKLKNTNLSRTLNIVIRELNQEFVTYLSLVDVTIAFANEGKIFDEYSISEIDKMLEKYVKLAPEGPTEVLGEGPPPLTRGSVRARLLEQIRRVVDFTGVPKDLLQEAEDPFGNTYLRVRRRRSIDARNPFYEDRDDIPVDGVVMNIDRNTIKTDSLIIDSLLGHGIALDNYALGMQQESLRTTQLENMKIELGLRLIEEGNDQKLEAFRSLFGSVDDELLTKVAVGNASDQ